ncbi:FHA domain-containing protein [Candidatus Protochlamydia sp. W-9]|uniref:FHA domain-containing protein n=1 Tax=Candidatus Protochlamydia sp. W-9 TaxID=1785087 RepID=UPI00096A348A|nr:FHA domain-containing protein [Candidatus Protochlamydia sp. W-9]
MIRLTINASSDSEIHLFDQSTILIGADAKQADLVLPGNSIQPIHLKIINQNGFLILINQAKDPFVSINGHPFGKKLLNSGDVISVHQNQLLFENLAHTSLENSNDTPLFSNHALDQKTSGEDPDQSGKIASSYSLNMSLPFENEIEALSDNEWNQTNLDQYLNLSTDSTHSISPISSNNSKNKEPGEKKSQSLKDDYLRDLDDENQTKKDTVFNYTLTESGHLIRAWKWFILFILLILTITGFVGTIIYFRFSDKAEIQETIASQGVADVAMALTYAKLYRLKPHNQNWADLDFLKNNFQAILADTPSYGNQIDAQGQFICCPYTLRIYTNSDLSHFLLIAQPAPSIYYWLIPKSTIVVDSNAMELRTLKDLRTLNRLLANPEPLEGTNGKDISALIKQGTLTRLATLSTDPNQQDFSPPKNLGWIKPGAENFIYNSPRYFRLGHPLIQKAINLATAKGTSQEVSALKQDVENFSKLPHAVLYSEQGKKTALQTKQGIATFAPSNKILLGYLLFNKQGKIQQAHLLKDEEEIKDHIFLKEKEQIALIGSEINEKNIKEENEPLHMDHTTHVDFNHPIYIQLQALTLARENELTPLSTALNHLINRELHHPSGHFQTDFQTLSHSYLMTDAKHRQLLKEALEMLYQQYEDMPINQFIVFVKQLHLEHLIIKNDKSIGFVDENCIQNLETMLTQIEKAKSLIELDNLIHICNSWLNFDYIKDPEELIKYQNLVRNSVLSQLEKHLLSQTKYVNVKEQDKEILKKILSHKRLIKSEEKDFFLEEFEALLTNKSTFQEENAEASVSTSTEEKIEIQPDRTVSGNIEL